jgi:hypothetical protein
VIESTLGPDLHTSSDFKHILRLQPEEVTEVGGTLEQDPIAIKSILFLRKTQVLLGPIEADQRIGLV